MRPLAVPGQAAEQAFSRRDTAGRVLADDAERVAAICHDMAVRFHRGGKLIVFGNGEAGTDASHVAVEFMHPVIVGKRALPALALSNDAATVSGVAARAGFAESFAHQLRYFGAAGDIGGGLRARRRRGGHRAERPGRRGGGRSRTTRTGIPRRRRQKGGRGC